MCVSIECMAHESRHQWLPEQGVGSPGAGVQAIVNSMACWEPSPGPLEEQCALMAEPSLQTHQHSLLIHWLESEIDRMCVFFTCLYLIS